MKVTLSQGIAVGIRSPFRAHFALAELVAMDANSSAALAVFTKLGPVKTKEAAWGQYSAEILSYGSEPGKAGEGAA